MINRPSQPRRAAPLSRFASAGVLSSPSHTGRVREGEGMTEGWIAVNDVQLWVADAGEGHPVLLCNGGPGCCDYLGPVAEMIDDMARVIRFEPRGCGQSDPTGPYDV